MYGLVNQGVHDLAVTLGGEPLWERIVAAAAVGDEQFVSMSTYPDEVTYRLVTAASTVLGLTEDEVLHAFGRHWVLYTAARGYGAIFDTMGRDLPEFLANLDAMHARLSLSMPDLTPPSFVCEELGSGRLRLEYWSDRPGLAPMVAGLLAGLGERFCTTVLVTHTVSSADGADHDEFVVEHSPLAMAVAPT
jgi:hypothetical protein